MTQRKILEIFDDQPRMTAAILAEAIGVSQRSIEMNIRKLKENGLLVHIGPTKGGYWEIKKS